MNVLAVDIDNTLTNASSPWNIASQDAKDINIANYLLSVDKRPGIEILHKCSMKIVLITARHEDYRDETLKWLENKSVKYDKLIMRNFRFSNGKFNLNEYIQYKHKTCLEYNINYMIDDDRLVVDFLNEHGIISTLVDKNGRFDTAYHELINKIK